MLWIWKKNTLLNLISHQPGFDEIYLYAKDPNEAEYKVLIKKREGVGLKHCNDPKAFIKYSNDMDDVCENIEEYHPNKNSKILTVFDGRIADRLVTKNVLQESLNYLLEVKNGFFFLFLLHNLILLYQKILDQILHTILLSKFQTNKSFKKSQLIICLVLL